MYTFFPITSVIGRELSSSSLNILNFLYLSMLRYYVIVPDLSGPLAKRLKVVIAAGLTSSHPEQSS